MIRRWHHGHSLATGLLAGLALATYRVWLLLAAAFLLGVVVALLVPRLLRLGGALTSFLGAETHGLRDRRYSRRRSGSSGTGRLLGRQIRDRLCDGQARSSPAGR